MKQTKDFKLLKCFSSYSLRRKSLFRYRFFLYWFISVGLWFISSRRVAATDRNCVFKMWYSSVVSQEFDSPGGVARGRQDLSVAQETAAGQVTWEETSQRVSSARVRPSRLGGATRWRPPHLCVRPAPWGFWGWRPWCCTPCTCCPDRRWPPGYRRGRRRRSSPRRTLAGRRPSEREKLEIWV